MVTRCGFDFVYDNHNTINVLTVKTMEIRMSSLYPVLSPHTRYVRCIITHSLLCLYCYLLIVDMASLFVMVNEMNTANIRCRWYTCYGHGWSSSKARQADDVTVCFRCGHCLTLFCTLFFNRYTKQIMRCHYVSNILQKVLTENRI